MAQNGGTWDSKMIRRQQVEEAKKHNSNEDSQKQKFVNTSDVSHNQDNKIDAQDWDIVENSEEELKLEPKPRVEGVSSQFNFQVGWGKWKRDLLSWDLKVGKVARSPEEAAPSSLSSTTKDSKK